LMYDNYDQARGPCTPSYADYEGCTTVCKLLCDEKSECRAFYTANQLQRLKPEYHANSDRIMCGFYGEKCTPHATFTNPTWDVYFQMFNSFTKYNSTRCESTTSEMIETNMFFWGCNLSPTPLGQFTYDFTYAACADHCALRCIGDAECVAFTIGSELGRTSNSNVMNQNNDCVTWKTCSGLQDPQNVNPNWDTYVRPSVPASASTTRLVGISLPNSGEVGSGGSVPASASTTRLVGISLPNSGEVGSGGSVPASASTTRLVGISLPNSGEVGSGGSTAENSTGSGDT